MSVSDCIQFVGLLVALGGLFWQSVQQTRMSRAAADAALIAKLDDSNRVLLEHPHLWQCLEQPYARIDGDPTRTRTSVYMFMQFNTLELAWRHFGDYHLIANREWSMWLVGIDFWVSQPYFSGWWVRAQDEYRADFRALVDARALVKAKPQAAPEVPA